MLQVFSWFGLLKYSGPIRAITSMVLPGGSRFTNTAPEGTRIISIDLVDGDRTMIADPEYSRTLVL